MKTYRELFKKKEKKREEEEEKFWVLFILENLGFALAIKNA